MKVIKHLGEFFWWLEKFKKRNSRLGLYRGEFYQQINENRAKIQLSAIARAALQLISRSEELFNTERR